MARYIDAEALTDHMLERYNELCEECGDYDHYTTGYGDAIDVIENAPTADVVPKSEVERLTINMNAYGLTAKRLAEENESLEIELENMRRNLGDAREGWNDAECEVERLRKALDEYEETSGLKQAKAEVAREIWEQIDVTWSERGCVSEFFENLAELKKKYTEVV
jgi:HPt (histidine-containing phosphotransfer) domain-containing protein